MSAHSTGVDFLWADDMKLPEWINAGWAEPLDTYLDKYWDEYNLSDIPQSLWDALSHDGKIYGIPILFNTRMLFYRTDLFAANNLTVPTTFDEWLHVCQVLTGDNKYGTAFALKDWDAVSFTFSEMLWSNGGEYLDSNLQPIFNGTEGVEALETLAEFLPYCPSGTITYSIDETMVDMQQGAIATAMQWATRAGRMDNNQSSTVAGKIGFAYMPAKPGYNGTIWCPVDCLWVSAFSEHKEEAVKLILESMKPEYQRQCVSLGLVPRQSVLQDPQVMAQYRWIANASKAAQYGRSLNNIPEPTTLFEELRQRIQEALLNQKTPKAALDEAAQAYYDVLVDKGYFTSG